MSTFILNTILSLVLLTNSVFAECDVQVASVRDGDTFNAVVVSVISPSVFISERTGFRLITVRTPERGEADYDKAKKDLEALILNKPVEVRLPTKGPKRDRWGRLLVDVFLCDGEKRITVNGAMRDKGWTSSGRSKR